MFCPGLARLVDAHARPRPSAWVRSTMTTASAPCGNGRPGHDARRLAGADGVARHLARRHFLDDGQLGARPLHVSRRAPRSRP